MSNLGCSQIYNVMISTWYYEIYIIVSYFNFRCTTLNSSSAVRPMTGTKGFKYQASRGYKLIKDVKFILYSSQPLLHWAATHLTPTQSCRYIRLSGGYIALRHPYSWQSANEAPSGIIIHQWRGHARTTNLTISSP